MMVSAVKKAVIAQIPKFDIAGKQERPNSGF